MKPKLTPEKVILHSLRKKAVMQLNEFDEVLEKLNKYNPNYKDDTGELLTKLSEVIDEIDMMLEKEDDK